MNKYKYKYKYNDAAHENRICMHIIKQQMPWVKSDK